MLSPERGPFVPFIQTRPEDIRPGLLQAYTDYTERHKIAYNADVSAVMLAIAGITPPDLNEIDVTQLPENTLTNALGVTMIMGFNFTTDVGYSAFKRFARILPETSVYQPQIIDSQFMRRIPNAKFSHSDQCIDVTCVPVANVPIIDSESTVQDAKYPIFMRQLTTPASEKDMLKSRKVLGVELAFVHPLVFANAPRPDFARVG